MKFLTPQLTYLLTQKEHRQNLKALARYFIFLAGTVGVYSVVFHMVMLWEGQEHSWLTGAYWTLTVMSTLGFGDITFHSDLGRSFSILVLLSGIVLLLIVLPFAFIRFFYAPWLEAQLRLRAPREAAPDVKGHVIVCHYDEIARGLIERLRDHAIPYYVIEPDHARAAEMHADGVSVVCGEVDAASTYEGLRLEHASLIVANLDDATNTAITLTVREHDVRVPIAALAEDKDSVDVLQLSGASAVLPLKHRLGEHLASRVTVGTHRAHPVGRFKELVIAEFPVHGTPLSGRTVADTRLRQLTGLNIIACSERGHLTPARADTVLSDHAIAVLVGTEDQIEALDAMFVIYEPNENPVLVIGGGKVGRSVLRALRAREVVVNVIERDPALRSMLAPLAHRVIIGDGAERETIEDAGVADAPSVVITTHDSAVNVFLSIYCRRLNPHAAIVSRLTAERNLESIHRAGADSVLSDTSLGVNWLLSLVEGRELVLAGEGVDLFVEPVPEKLAGRTLADSGIAGTTGLNVVAVQKSDGPATNPGADTVLDPSHELVLLGTTEQRDTFREVFA
ncbi:MAG: potassium channel family protein [Myxococcota bacterium]